MAPSIISDEWFILQTRGCTTTAETLEKWLEKGLFIPSSGLYYVITAVDYIGREIGGGCDLHLDSFKGTRA